MSWIALGLAAGLILGTYDVLTKVAVSRIDVLSLVFLSTIFGSSLWLPFFVYDEWMAELTGITLRLDGLSAAEHLYILPKSVMMISSWVLAYFSVKNLPLSISAGVRATGPLWTAAAAIIFLGEYLTPIHWLGFAVATFAYYRFSMIGKREGLQLGTDIWAFYMLAATLLSSGAQVYDKYLLTSIGLESTTVQAISAAQRAFLVFLLLPLCYKTLLTNGRSGVHWSVFAVGAAMILAEFVYLSAVNVQGAMIAIISILRRTNLVVVYLVGALIFKDHNPIPKFVAICGVVIGIIIVTLPTLGAS